MQLQDIDIRLFKEDLVRFVNNNPLPLEIKRLVLKEVTGMVTEVANDVIITQRQCIEQPTPEENKKDVPDKVEENE